MNYYKLKSPITSIRTIPAGGHTDVHIWINGGKAGTLCVRNEELVPFQDLLRQPTFSAQISHDASRGGPKVHWTEPLGLDECLVGEDGSVTTLAKLREMCRV